MITIISPAKSLDFSPVQFMDYYSDPEFLATTSELLAICKKLSKTEIQNLMKISDKLAELNYNRFEHFNNQPEKPAIYAYDGDVYENIDKELVAKNHDFAQKHLRIISGLYGVLKPFDLIRAYRLEMSTMLMTKNGKSCKLSEYWQQAITTYFNQLLDKQQDLSTSCLNLASAEYSSAINSKNLHYPIINVHFKEYKNGKFEVIGIKAKKARGMMANFVIKHNIDKPKDLLAFNQGGYNFNPELSSDYDLCFTSS